MFRNIRLGFATNSSSAHSIIFHPDYKFAKDYDNDSFDGYDSIGRDRFSFSELADKLGYVLFCNDINGRAGFSNHDILSLLDEMKDARTKEEVRSVIGKTRQPDDNPPSKSDYLVCPDGVDFNLWVHFLLDPRVSFHGYDDNYGPHFEEIAIRDPYRLEVSNHVWKQDGNALVGFNMSSGTKIRWSQDEYTKSSVPELVDLKITDHCGHNCQFCYQGSSENNRHAPYKRIKNIIDELASLGVFEIAIGGGEPVSHPDFWKIMGYITKKNMVANFTTFGTDWSKDIEKLKAFEKELKYGFRNGVGVSIHSAKDVKKAVDMEDLFKRNHIWCHDIHAQMVLGATPEDVIRKTFNECVEHDQPLLLLGYKQTGRGGTFRKLPTSDAFIETLLIDARAVIETRSDPVYDEKRFRLSVDTAFIDQYGHLLEKLGVPKILWASPEGKFSMYIDAVENTVAPSSYCDSSLVEPRVEGKIKDAFVKW